MCFLISLLLFWVSHSHLFDASFHVCIVDAFAASAEIMHCSLFIVLFLTFTVFVCSDLLR